MTENNNKLILVMSPYVPWPLHGGTVVRIFNTIKELSRRGYSIVLLAGSDGLELKTDNPLHALCQEIHLFKLNSSDSLMFKLASVLSLKPYPFLKFQTGSLRKKINQLLTGRKFDLILANLSVLVDALDTSFIKDTPVLFDHPECEELVYIDYIKKGSLPLKIFSLINLAKFKLLHKSIFLKADAIVCVSKEETDFTKKEVREAVPVYTIPNGVDPAIFHPRLSDKKPSHCIIFCSSMRVRRNVDAAVWFATSIFPRIKKVFEGIEFWIIGSNPTPEVMALTSISGVKVVGTVENIEDYYRMGKVFVAPYHFGAGTKLKVLEAMASGIPIVSTSIGCRGIEAINNQHILIADDQEQFIASVNYLLKNEAASQKLAENALALIHNKYSWKKIVDQLELIMANII